MADQSNRARGRGRRSVEMVVAAESEMKPAAAGGRAAMVGRRMARGRRVRVMQESRSKQGAVTADVDRRACRRADGGHKGSPVARGCRVGEEAGRSQVSTAGDMNQS